MPFFDQVLRVIGLFEEANSIYRAATEEPVPVLVQPKPAPKEPTPPPPPKEPTRKERPGPYEVLGVTEDAPDFVVKAAYKAAAKRYHADKGGEGKLMSRLNAAFQEIKRRRGW